VNISFLTEKLSYSQICGKKVGPYKKRGHSSNKPSPNRRKYCRPARYGYTDLPGSDHEEFKYHESLVILPEFNDKGNRKNNFGP